MTEIIHSDPMDLQPDEYQEDWPPSEEDIEAMEEWQAKKDYEDLCRTVPDAAERNRNLANGHFR